MAKFKRILLKLSGESLMGEKKYGIDEKRLGELVDHSMALYGVCPECQKHKAEKREI